MSQDIGHLLSQIKSAFAGLPKPKVTKRVARAYDDEWFPKPERCAALRALDRENAWTDLLDSEIEDFHEIFLFLDDEGYRFYLPAYMSYYLRHFPNPACDAAYAACTDRKKLAALTAEQLASVESFLEICHEAHLRDDRGD